MTTSPSWCCASPTKAFLSHFMSGVEGIRTPDLRRAKSARVFPMRTTPFENIPIYAVFGDPDIPVFLLRSALF